MPIRAQALSAMHYFATDSDGPKTGDEGNHTLKVVEDGVVGSVAGTPSEIDATNAPGMYKVAITAAENTADVVTLCGKSSTSGVTISPVTWTNITNADADVAAILVDTGTTLNNAVNTIDNVVDAILVDTAVLGASPIAANVTQVNGVAAAAVAQAAGAATIAVGTVLTGSTTSLIKLHTDFSSVDDFYNNKRLIFTDGALAGQSRLITDYVGSTRVATVDPANTSAAGSGDGCIIV